MRAQKGDHIVIEGTKAGAHRREGEILETHGPDGGPPFRIRWDDTGAEGILSPGPDAHLGPRSSGPEPAGQ